MAKLNVLVLCTGNSARSQMAEAFLRKYGSERFEALAPGPNLREINPLTLQVMREVGLDLSRARSKNLREYLGILPVYYLIIVCHDADQKCPTVWPGVFKRMFWPFEDPAACVRLPRREAAEIPGGARPD